MPTQNNNIIDIDLSVTRKKKIRINGDDNRILELNTSDMSTVTRISEAYPKLQALQEKAAKLADGVSLDDDTDDGVVNNLTIISDRLKAIDGEMRELIDYIFNANVSEITAPDGSMYDPFNGSFRFEHIISVLIDQYENNLKREYEKMAKQMHKHTAKYKHKQG